MCQTISIGIAINGVLGVQELRGCEVIGIQDGLMARIRMLKGLEKSLEKHLPESERR